MARSIAKLTVPGDLEGRTDLTWEVYRDFSKEGNWHDRYVQNQQGEVLYFCFVEPREDIMDKEYIFHRGGKDGPVIARATPCADKKYALDLRLEDPPVTIPISHSHSFRAGGKRHCWKPSDGDYEANIFTGAHYRVPSMTLQQIQDLVVVTALITEMKEEEKMGPHTLARKRAWELHELDKEDRSI
jgi:hypothetical protein